MNTTRSVHTGFLSLLTVALFSLAGDAGPVANARSTHPDTATASDGTGQLLESKYGQLPLAFEQNTGQTDARADFVSRGKGHTLFLTEGGGATFSLTARNERAVLRLTLPGSSPTGHGIGHDMLPGKVSYLTGSDRRQWRQNVNTYTRVKYDEVYPGIALVYYGNQNHLEYDFVVRAAADPDAIVMRFDGADALELGADGNLAITVRGQQIVQKKPVAYQERAGTRELVAAAYEIGPDHRVTFRLGSYDRARELVIDPVLVYSTLLGGGHIYSSDRAEAIAVDATGSGYVVGATDSVDFPTTSTFGGALNGSVDIFVAKLSADGSRLVYGTYLGGSDTDSGLGIALDASGSAYVTGFTYSYDFPTTNGAFDRLRGGRGDAFVAKLNPEGDGLVYSTYLGGDGFDFALGISVDSVGSAYVTGETQSTNFPTTTASYDTSSNGVLDAFVAKLSGDGSGLVYSTYLGGSSGDSGREIAVDTWGNAYVSGSTASDNFPVTPGAWDTTWNGNSDAFVAKLNTDGSGLAYGTYLGGTLYDVGAGIAIDTHGSAYVTGETFSADFPTTNGAYDRFANGGYDVFVVKLSADGGSLTYATYLGGSSQDFASGIAIDTRGGAYVVGTTISHNVPTTSGAFPSAWNRTNDVFVTKLSSDGGRLVFSTYLSGEGEDSGGGIAVDDGGSAYVVGRTESGNFRTTSGAFDETLNGRGDGFVVKIEAGPDPETESIAAYVTGAGTIVSPAGALVANPAATGDATFGFFARNQAGATRPSGKAELTLGSAGFQFTSTVYQSLTVFGMRAQMRGEGTVNGFGGFDFLLTVTDKVPPSIGVSDEYRMIVWLRATGTVVYDNVPGAPVVLDATPHQPISSGAIALHR